MKQNNEKKVNKFLVSKVVKEKQQMEEHIIDMNSCGFKSVFTDYGKYYAHQGQVVVSVLNTPEEIEAIATQQGFTKAAYTTAINKSVKEYFADDSKFFVVMITDWKKANKSQIIPNELVAELVELKEAGFKGEFNVNYKPSTKKGFYEIRLSYKPYNGWFHNKNK